MMKVEDEDEFTAALSVLGLPLPYPDERTLTLAYRRESLKYHPDKGPWAVITSISGYEL